MTNSENTAKSCKICGSTPEPKPDMGAYIPGGKVYFGCNSCNAMVGIDLRDPEYKELLASRDVDLISNKALSLLSTKWNQFFVK